jgi:hypothetical protein
MTWMRCWISCMLPESTSIPGGTRLISGGLPWFNDPEGNRVELWETPKTPPA